MTFRNEISRRKVIEIVMFHDFVLIFPWRTCNWSVVLFFGNYLLQIIHSTTIPTQMKKRTYTLTVIASTVVAIVAVVCIIIILAAGRNDSGGGNRRRRVLIMDDKQANESYDWVVLENLRNDVLGSVKSSPLLRGRHWEYFEITRLWKRCSLPTCRGLRKRMAIYILRRRWFESWFLSLHVDVSFVVVGESIIVEL